MSANKLKKKRKTIIGTDNNIVFRQVKKDPSSTDRFSYYDIVTITDQANVKGNQTLQ